MNQRWFVSVDGVSIRGPLAFDELKRVLVDIGVRVRAVVVCQGMRDWIDADCVPGLFPQADRVDWRPPPLPPRLQDRATSSQTREGFGVGAMLAAGVGGVAAGVAARSLIHGSPNFASSVRIAGTGSFFDAVAIDYDGDDIVDAVVVDFDGDGITDAVGIDFDNDGDVDAVGIDLDGDGNFDAVGVDLDGDGDIDAVGVDLDDDGDIDAVGVDVDGDGDIDVVGVDEDGDGDLDGFADIGGDDC